MGSVRGAGLWWSGDAYRRRRRKRRGRRVLVMLPGLVPFGAGGLPRRLVSGLSPRRLGSSHQWRVAVAGFPAAGGGRWLRCGSRSSPASYFCGSWEGGWWDFRPLNKRSVFLSLQTPFKSSCWRRWALPWRRPAGVCWLLRKLQSGVTLLCQSLPS